MLIAMLKDNRFMKKFRLYTEKKFFFFSANLEHLKILSQILLVLTYLFIQVCV